VTSQQIPRTYTRVGAVAQHRLTPLFKPGSVALVGASDRSAWSALIHATASSYDFDGRIYYVNPRGGEAHGQPLHTSLAALPEVPDLVFLMIPAHAVVSTLEEAAALGVRAAEILSSGFAEVGPEGVLLQQQVAGVVRRTGMVVLGPNNLGFTNVPHRIALAPSEPGQRLRAGGIAMVSQSGNLMGQIQGLATMFDIGLSLLVSTGNEVDVTVADVIDYIVDDPDTTAIGVFVETIRDPDAFRRAAVRARKVGKPVVVLKVGRSEAAARSALAHTGALVGDDAIVDAALAGAGAIRVESLEELLATADIHARLGTPRGSRLGVVSISGGAGDIAGDLAHDAGIEIPAIADETAEALRKLLPDYGTAQNPLDMTGAVVAERHLFGAGLAALAQDPGLDAVIAITEAEHMATGRDDPMLAPLLEAAARAPIPAILATTTVKAVRPPTKSLREGQEWPTVSWGLQRTIDAIASLIRWSTAQVEADPARGGPIDASRFGPTTGTWSEQRARRLLADYGVPMVPATIVRDDAELPAELGAGPFVLKIVSDDIPHKTDVGGVRLGVARCDVASERRALVARVRAAAPSARLDGVMVAPMRADGIDLLVGVVRDDAWGCVLAIAMGGIWTELLGDVRRLALPTSSAAIRQALKSLKAAPLLDGARGTGAVDVDALVDAIAAVADVACRLGPDLAALEVNPLRADGARVEALDAMVVWRD
jgi:acetate---CoA ligase (ADP-forming)